MCNSTLENLQNPLAKNFTIRSLLQFAFPTIVMMIFMGLYTIGDTIVISRFVNTDALSALNIVTPVINIIVGLGAILATGGSAIVAIIGSVLIDNIIWGLGASELLFSYCKQYLFILLLFTPASMMQVLFQNLIVTAGKPGLGMVLSISARTINVLLDYIFVVPMNMGIAGSALGTGIGYMITTVIGIVFFLKSKGTLRFRKPVIDLHVLWESGSNGFSEMVSQVATAVTTFLFNIMMMKLLDENGVAAITIIIYMQFLLTTLYIGFSMGVAPIISYNFGSKDYGNLKRIFRICLLFICIISVVIFATAILLGSRLVRIFSPIGTPVYEIAQQGFLILPSAFYFAALTYLLPLYLPLYRMERYPLSSPPCEHSYLSL